MSVLWSVDFGVNASHHNESAGVFTKLKDAVVAFDSIELGHPWKVKRIVRMGFEGSKFCGATSVKTIRSEEL